MAVPGRKENDLKFAVAEVFVDKFVIGQVEDPLQGGQEGVSQQGGGH